MLEPFAELLVQLLLEVFGELILQLFVESSSKLLAIVASGLGDFTKNLFGW
jgi:hypothetical protein